MLTRDEIMKKLEDDLDWHPSVDASDDEWDLYEEVRREVAKRKGITEEEDYSDPEDHDDGDFEEF